MITELFVISPILLLWYLEYTSFWITLFSVYVLYWIPKICITIFEIVFPNVLFRKNGESKNIYLTIDDVPYDDKTYEEIINILNEINAKATFFVISGQVSIYIKKKLIEAVKQGHTLANHGHTNTMHALLSATKLSAEIEACDKLIKEIYNAAEVKEPDVLYYRPGCGIFTNKMFNIITNCDSRYKLVLGSVYPNDPIIRIPWINYHYLINHVEGGDIVIIHDRKWTPEMLKDFLAWVLSSGYNLSSLK